MFLDVDERLSRIFVSKDDVFLMADARRLLKAIFDTLGKEDKNAGQTDRPAPVSSER